jgi:hypothetical protein
MLALAVVLGAACARDHRPTSAAPARPTSGDATLERAIAARGGPIAGLVRESEVQVAIGFPGGWRWRTVTALPERYAWTIATNAQPNHYLFDGTVVRAFVGDALVSEEPAATSPLATHARFAAVADLDLLRTAAVTLMTADGALAVEFHDRPARYEIAFSADALVASVKGPIDLSPMGRGTLTATYDDYGEIQGRRIAHHIHYTLDGTTLADERVLRSCILQATPPPSAFESPATVPTCK